MNGARSLLSIGLAALTSGLLTSAEAAAPATARALAERVHRASGGDAIGRVGAIHFRFVVLDGKDRKLEAEHHWDLRRGRDRVLWKSKDGKRCDATVDLATRAAEGTIDGVQADGAVLAALGKEAYERWVNDSYWLMMPTKLLDPGVKLTLEADREWKGRTYHVLELSFDQVGLTPGDVYWLLIDPETAQVVRWEMVLEGDQPPPKGSSWEEYRRLGPLLLAHTHVSDSGKKIVFEDTKVE